VKISVITTVFNGEDYVDRAVDSIMSQEYANFEWLIVDDGSEDNTVEKLRAEIGGDPRVHIFTPGRLGRARALNFAVDKAKGSFIANHDFDDISYPDRLALQVQALDENPKVGVIGGYHVAVDEKRRERYVREQPLTHDAIVRAMTRYIPFAHTIVAFRKSVWEEVGGYPIADNAIDMRMWLRVATTDWKMRNIPEVLGEHFVYGNSFWHQNYNYAYRQFDLARLQAQIVRDVDLPKWMYLYPMSRLVYAWLPTSMKRYVRRMLGGSKEKDI
jgi:glycosyltransferase involved in cell wall biosynthesis